jgi:hypothetical protein
MGKRSRIRQRAPIGAKEGQRFRTALVAAQRRIRELGEEREEVRREVAKLRRVVADQTEQIEALTARVEFVMSREEELRAMLLSAHDQLMRRAEKMRADLVVELQRSVPQPDTSSDAYPVPEVPTVIRPGELNLAPGARVDYEQLSKYFAYRRLVDRIQEVANAVLPSEATVAVVSKGDEELLELGGGRRGWHFPQNEDGAYAGYYPADSAEAIAHLEELREKGAGFLLFPETSFWWFENYKDFGEHLNARYRRVWDDETYAIFELSEIGSPEGEGTL